jgi:hypothetical protein
MEKRVPYRRGFQFGLGTMFLAVTALAVWLGWEMNIWRERQPMRRWVTENGGDYEENIEFRE